MIPGVSFLNGRYDRLCNPAGCSTVTKGGRAKKNGWAEIPIRVFKEVRGDINGWWWWWIHNTRISLISRGCVIMKQFAYTSEEVLCQQQQQQQASPASAAASAQIGGFSGPCRCTKRRAYMLAAAWRRYFPLFFLFLSLTYSADLFF